MEPITAVVLGAGSRGSTYAGYAKEHPEALQIVAIAEPRRDRLDALAEEVGVRAEYRFESWEALLAQPKLADCAFICTLDDDHTAPAIKAMELGPDGAIVRNITLFAVMIYEIIGPFLTKIALTKAGDIQPEGRKSAREEHLAMKLAKR